MPDRIFADHTILSTSKIQQCSRFRGFKSFRIQKLAIAFAVRDSGPKITELRRRM